MIDREQLIDREMAALLVGVEPCTIDAWVKRKHLTRAETAKHGKALYKVGAVLDAERTTRRNSRVKVRRNPRQLTG